MNLKHLTDKVLLEDTKKLASSEREVTVKVLHHLKEIDRRRLYSDLGFSSLYDYCVRELGYAEASAHRRIVSARLLKEMPTIEIKVQTGALTLTNIASLSQFFREQNIKDTDQKEKIVGKVLGLSRRECDLKLMQLSDRPIEKKHCIWVGDAVMEKLRSYRDLRGTDETSDEIILDALSIAIEEFQRQKFKLARNPKPSNTSDNRVPTASVKREVFLRDQKCVKCGSMRSLQFDHKHPYALGGKTTPENMRLLCFSCNQRERIRQRL